jgi:hypothetical protein
MDVLARARMPSGNLPAGDLTLLSGQNYIFAVGDGSESPALIKQTISITLDSEAFRFADATTTLAPSGVLFGDTPALGGGDETQPWVQDADLFGSQGTSTIPEPASVTLLAIGIAGLPGHGWRRRKLAAS